MSTATTSPSTINPARTLRLARWNAVLLTRNKMSLLYAVVMPLAPLLGGYLLEHQGGTTAVTALVVASALLAALLTSSRSIRSVPRPSEWVTHEETAPALAA